MDEQLNLMDFWKIEDELSENDNTITSSPNSSCVMKHSVNLVLNEIIKTTKYFGLIRRIKRLPCAIEHM